MVCSVSKSGKIILVILEVVMLKMSGTAAHVVTPHYHPILSHLQGILPDHHWPTLSQLYAP